jgi:hypothetical protein
MTDEERTHTALFLNFVMSLAQSGMMQLGKIMNPMTGKVEQDLDGVRGTIGLLTMLRAKTEGNLSKEERDILSGSISSLQLNYVEEMKKPSEPAQKDAEVQEQEEAPKDEDVEQTTS